jgi:hypothetical protein
MAERYEPPSEFLKMLVEDDVPLACGEQAEHNLTRLIEMTRDEHTANRDWATMLLAQEEIDTLEVREALLVAAHDEDNVVRAEAILGLARRDRMLALPLVRDALSGEEACMALFEAAALVADPSLIEALEPWVEPSDYDYLDRLAREALEACQQRQPTT